MKAGRPTDLNVNRIIRSIRVINDRITYGDKVANDIHALFMHRRHNHSEIYRAPNTIQSEAICIDVCQILGKVYEWEKICQDETSFHWRHVLTDSALTSLPMIVHTPVLMNGLSAENQELLRRAYTLYTRTQRRQWYSRVQDSLVEQEESRRESLEPAYHKTVSALMENYESHVHGPECLENGMSDSATTDVLNDVENEHKHGAEAASCSLERPSMSRTISEAPLYPASYTHKFKYTCGVSSDRKFNPLERIKCYKKMGTKYEVRPLLTVLQEKAGKDPLFEKRITFLQRN
jgi:HD superfamily phosphohydrolase